MKKARVIIKTVTKHQVYVEQDGERFLYALTSDLVEAKKLVQKAKREFGIGRPGKPRNDTVSQSGKIRASQATAQ